MQAFSPEEIENYRKLFPVTRDWIYLNHAGVAPISRRVAEAVELFNREALEHGYTQAARWHKRIEEIRATCARLIGAEAGEIAFVKNTSHGLSLIARGLGLKEGDEVLISEAEFPSNVYPWMALEKSGVVLKKIPARGAELDLGHLERLITEKTRVVSLSSVQYGSGYRLPVAEIGRLCRDTGIYFMLDAIQSLGAFPLDVDRDRVDFLAADAHKWLLGHEGIGVLYVRKALIEKIEPALLGWNSVVQPLDFDRVHFELRPDAGRFEEGSHNSLSIYGLGAAVELLLEAGIPRIADRILSLTGRLIAGLQELDLELASPLLEAQRSGIVSFRLPEDPEGKALPALERRLHAERVYATVRRRGLRLSPHFYNTMEEMDRVLALIKKIRHSAS
ncbi:MAG: aminotransferase class V-fold PLP-dependent enzyme [Deltaproteobacteria bacterium]|nr:aminotransferase class V-fold PLP-dependent enzyme [Deltaproteobacteria bacterium]